MTSTGFDLRLHSRIVFGENSVDRLGELAAELEVTRAVVVTDAGVVAAGHVERAEEALHAAGLATGRFADVRENPSTEDVDACLAFVRDFRPDLFVGLGGGSSIDTAKGANFLYSCGGAMRDYWGVGKATHEMLPLIAVPTTAGTGTEVHSFALISDAETHQKMACGDSKAAPRIALLDPTLTVTMPPFVTACTGLDAIGHAVETAVTTGRNPASSLFSREAFHLAMRSFPRVLAAPDDLAARGRMLQASAHAGIAIENSMLGAAHAMANPLTARFDVVHGQAVTMMLPFVVAYNAVDEATARIYGELARGAGLCEQGCDDAEAVEALVTTLRSMLVQAGLPTSIADCGVTREDCTALAEEAARQWTAQHNPREVRARDLIGLYEEACESRA